ncbi:DUF6746 domain-containing protein [Vreelandella rituensis]|uniref:Uncharacterized protein n=1 Tax=Vreelandella rituensis TaxID=2282306 RepID=A0A368U327_9GAMM|nr:DUF6746 family protein [Halomonas rituensis]RCV91414.1 hypothetical protein DU506_10345 [Halomonas rituensis]
MKRIAFLMLAGLISSGVAMANDHEEAHDRAEHFEGKPAETMEEAVANFSEGNQQLAEMLASDELTNEQMGELHMLTYTLENALLKIDEEVKSMAVSLEEVHLGSETLDQERVATNGVDYLEVARTLAE